VVSPEIVRALIVAYEIVSFATKFRIAQVVANATTFWQHRSMKKLSDLHNSTWRLFLTAHVKLLDRIEAKLTEADLPPLEWYDVLLTLKEAPDYRLRLSEVADKVLLSRSNLTRLVDRLETAGLLRRERCPNDRRGAFAVLTEAGLAMQQTMWTVYSEGITEYFSSYLSTEESRMMEKALARMLAALEKE